jgi:hypothetical protein
MIRYNTLSTISKGQGIKVRNKREISKMLQFEKERRQHGHLSQMHQVVEKYLLFS